MQLSKRLEMLASMVTVGGRLADVGTDHAYLPIALLKSGRISAAIAMDVREGPLVRAKTHIEEAELSSYIETRLSDGLEKPMPGEADTIVIAGMGGPLINRISQAHPEVAESTGELILQPQSEIGDTRRFLAETGFEIVQEEMVVEDGKYYPMMRVVPGKAYRLTDIQQEFGPLLIEKKHPVLIEWLALEKKKCGAILEKIKDAENAGNVRTGQRKEQVRARQKMIQAVLENRKEL